MAETVSEIRLRIAALLDKGEFAAAQSEMAKLKDAVDDIQEAQTEVSEAAKEAAESAQQASEKTVEGNQAIKGSAAAALGTMSALQLLISGNISGAIRQLLTQVSHLDTRFSGLAAKISGPAVAGSIGFALGTVIDRTFKVSDTISRSLIPSLDSMKDGWDRAFQSADKLANLKLSRLSRELQDVLDKLDAITKETNLEKRLADRERAAAAQADIADIEASMPAGPERDRAVLARRRQAEEEQRRADEAALATLDAAQKKAQSDLAELRASAGREIAAEEAKTAVLIDRAQTTGNQAAWKALGDQRRRAERLRKEYAEQEAEIAKELADIEQQQAETRSELKVRALRTREEFAKGSISQTDIADSERQQAEAARRRAAQAEATRLQEELRAAQAAAKAAGIELPAPGAAPAAADGPQQAQQAQRRGAQPTPQETLDATEPTAALLKRRVAAGNTRVDQRLGRAPEQPAESAGQDGTPAQPTSARDALAAFQASREVDGRRMSERSRTYQDKLAAMQEAAEQEAAANAQYVAAVTGSINQITAQLAAAKAQLRTQEDF